MSSSNSQSQKPSLNYGSPCAGCKFLRRKCLPDCIFAPYFPADQPQNFEVVHAIYGASNVAKLLNQLSHEERDTAAKSLIYEAEAWQRDPVHGCIGFISILHKKLNELQIGLAVARQELSTYIVSEPNNVNVLQPRWPGESSSQPPMIEGQSSLSQQLDRVGTLVIQQSPAAAEQLLPPTKQPPLPQNQSGDNTDFEEK